MTASTPTPRTLAIGDIHGCSRAFDLLLAAVRPQADDEVITLGDYVDRGPDSSGVLERLLRLKNACRLIPLRGNHDQMMLDARSDPVREEEWLSWGGRETLASYSVLGDAGKLVDVPESHWEFLERECLDWYETPTHFFVHANACPELALADQPVQMLYWERLEDPRPHCSGKTMVCGHTSQRTGIPWNLGWALCLDTWVYGKGWLTCMDMATGQLWQADERGRQRAGWIDDLAALTRS